MPEERAASKLEHVFRKQFWLPKRSHALTLSKGLPHAPALALRTERAQARPRMPHPGNVGYEEAWYETKRTTGSVCGTTRRCGIPGRWGGVCRGGRVWADPGRGRPRRD